MATTPTTQQAPIETKVVIASWTSVLTGLATWAITTYIPHVPTDLKGFLPFVVAAICSTAAGYFAKHTPRPEESIQAVFKLFGNPEFLQSLETAAPAPDPLAGILLPGPGPVRAPATMPVPTVQTPTQPVPTVDPGPEGSDPQEM